MLKLTCHGVFHQYFKGRPEEISGIGWESLLADTKRAMYEVLKMMMKLKLRSWKLRDVSNMDLPRKDADYKESQAKREFKWTVTGKAIVNNISEPSILDELHAEL